MYNHKRSAKIRPTLTWLLITGAFIVDIVFSVGRFPISTIIVCAIVVIYEFVSPFVYSSR